MNLSKTRLRSGRLMDSWYHGTFANGVAAGGRHRCTLVAQVKETVACILACTKKLCTACLLYERSPSRLTAVTWNIICSRQLTLQNFFALVSRSGCHHNSLSYMARIGCIFQITLACLGASSPLINSTNQMKSTQNICFKTSNMIKRIKSSGLQAQIKNA